MIAPSHLPLHHTTLGPASADPVLYVHGFPVCGRMWLEAASRLHEDLLPGRFRHIVPDLRGMGRSAAPSDVATIPDYTDDLVHLLSHLDEDRPAVVVGLSMGVVIALDFFRRYRDSLRALVLVDGRANPESERGKGDRESMAQQALARGSVVFADALADKAFHPDAPGSLKHTWHEIMASTPRPGAAAASRALASREDSRPTLPTIDVPTLLVCGSHDEITPPALMREMHESIRGSRFALIDGAGHMTPVEQPEAFADTLGAFLDSLPALD